MNPNENNTISMISDEDLAELRECRHAFSTVRHEVEKVVFGQPELNLVAYAAMLARGHVLLVSEPGKAKTRFVGALGKAFYKIVNGEKRKVNTRLQCVPDMPPPCGDWLINKDREPTPSVSEVVTENLVLLDEINRTPPKTQAGMLEPMEDYSLTMTYGEHRLVVATPRPYTVLATMNPIEQAGTYPLPEAQLDRFLFMFNLPYPDADSELRAVMDPDQAGYDPLSKVQQVCDITRVVEWQNMVERLPVSEEVGRYAVRLVRSTRPDSPDFAGGILVPRRGGGVLKLSDILHTGASVRASMGLIRGARAYRALVAKDDSPQSFQVTFEDVKHVAQWVLPHRVFTTLAGSRVNTNEMIRLLVKEVPVDGHYEDPEINMSELLKEAGTTPSAPSQQRVSLRNSVIDWAVRRLSSLKAQPQDDAAQS